MAALRFVTVNFIEATAAILKNGTGGGAPALDEVSPYLMTNAMKHARRVLWQNSGGVAMQFDVDLTGAASNKTTRVGGMAAHRPIAGALTGITAFTIKFSTHANGYPPVSGNPWTDVPGAVAVSTGSARDKGVVFASDVTARYFRFDLTVGSTFTLGKFFLGIRDYDLGFLYSPGVQILGISPNVEERTVGIDPVISYVGDDRELWTIPYHQVLSASVTILDALRKLRSSFLMIDKSDVFREVIVQRGEFGRAITFEQTSDTISDAELNLEQLG
jgi:hypothetical protein